MKSILAIVAAIVSSAAVTVAIIHKAGPSTSELDAAIAATKIEIAEAKVDSANFTGGLLLLQGQLRYAILNNTLAMLLQKREALLRGITLVYREPTPRVANSADKETTKSELAKARTDAEAAHREASMYSGGLLRTVALLREATAKATEAVVEQRIALERLGIPLASLPGGVLPVAKSPGDPTSDKDALQ